MTGPYAQAAGDYLSAGWTGVLNLPAKRKGPPPEGFTGWAGKDPSRADVMAWAEQRPEGNIALHLPAGVIGLDVDNYGDKAGAASLASGERLWGLLPPTWRTTSRDDGVSGIRLYTVPTGLRWPGGFGPGTETIHGGHRYVVAPPSIHPDTGKPYRWITPGGATSLRPPRVDELPALPVRWVVGLTENRSAHVHQEADMDDDEVRGWLVEHSHGQPCVPMKEALSDTLDEMGGGAHESLRLLMRIVGLAASGHDGLTPALTRIHDVFVDELHSRPRDRAAGAEEEWRRSLGGAVRKVVGEMAKTGTRTSKIDPCEVLVSPASGPASVSMPDAVSVDGAVAPTPGSTSDASDERSDENSLDIPRDVESSDEDVSGGSTPEEVEERYVLHELMQLRRREKAKQRLQAENAPPFRALGFGEFKLGPEPEPVVPGLLYRDSLSRIFGAPGCGKSFLALDLAFSVALGRPWAGEEVKQVPVAYVMAEGQRVNKLRAEAWQERHHVTDDELEGHFYAVPDALALTEAAIGPFVAWIKDTGVGLVVLDTKNAMQVGEENSATDAAIMRRALDAIRKATDACVVLIDHTGKHDGEEARGSSAVKAAMDTEIRVDNDGKSPAKVTVTVSRDKAAEAGRQWELMLRMAARAAVLLPLGEDVDLPAPRPLPGEVERAWVGFDRPLPEAVIDYAGPGKAAVPDLAKFMAHDAGVADPDGIGVSQAEAKAALSIKVLGKTAGHSPAAVRRAWSALRAMGYLAPADGKDGSDGKAENTVGKHVWTARNDLR